MTSTAPKEGTDPKNPVRIYTDGIFDCFHIFCLLNITLKYMNKKKK